MGELKVNSLRFSFGTSTAMPSGERKVSRLFKLIGLESHTSGEATIAPAAANVSLEFFGQTLTLRSINGTVYVYFGKLARADHDRPWIRLGRGGLSELFAVNGHPVRKSAKTTEPQLAEPKLAEPPFAVLATLLAGAREVREVGPATVDGQQVTSFLATLEPAQLKSEALASVSRLQLPPSPPPTVTLEVSLTPNGLPLRTVISSRTTIPELHSAVTGLTYTLESPAVNFPLVIEAPPPAQTIDVRQIRKLGRQARKEKQARKAKKKPGN